MDPEAEKPKEPDQAERDVFPSYDVRNCIVCGRPMEARKCKYVCRTCGTLIDCSDAY